MSRVPGGPDEAKQESGLKKENLSGTGTDAIVDNRNHRVGDFLRDNIEPGSNLSFVSAYFTIYAYEAMRDVLEKSGRMRFLYGDPIAVGVPDPSDSEGKAFKLNEDGGMTLKQALTQKPLACACAAWIQRQVDIRTIKQANFLHGKLYHIERENEMAALAGSSNFTLRGLGYGVVPNVELNLDVRNPADRTALLDWFDGLWGDESLTRDAKSDVLDALGQLGQPYAPAFVYYKTLFHVFKDWLEQYGQRDGLLHDIHLHDTQIWKHLYAFQKDGATSAINRLVRHNGCIVADSVGLGKTWTALAVIKYFELRNEKVLVLCPKRLEDNWTRYAAWAASYNNPFEKDRLNYTVCAHTDLSRYEGRAGQVDLANFNWGGFDLIVIDESHNFRNVGQDRVDETGKAIRSRYNRLLEEALKGGVRTKVLMLSATPVNTSFRDLRNQIYLMTEKREDAFRETLGIGNIQSMFGRAEHKFQQWNDARINGKKPRKSDLLESLGTDFLALLDAVSFARSREHIRRYYSEVMEKIGGFPLREKPENLYPVTDSQGELSYDDLHDQISKFRLTIYMPSEYLKDPSSLGGEENGQPFNQRDREHILISMMRVNLLKRLESSVHAFTLTLYRILEKMDDLDQRIAAWRDRGEMEAFDAIPEEDEEDDEFVVGKGRRRYRLDELDVDKWQRDLHEDRQVLGELHHQAKQVTVERDAKFMELKAVLRRKIEQAPIDMDGKPNRKALVFTTFADTAYYLYEYLEEWAQSELGVQLALVTGGGNNRSSVGKSAFNDILARFSPRAQQAEIEGDEIDIVIATDCLSEGQNLQDCDLVVNYDIHWNPVRLMQRFGRIDRLGSRNRQVAMTNFWPTEHLDRYLSLKDRVEARMALVDVAATGLDDPLNQGEQAKDERKGSIQMELTFRDKQLTRMRDEILDIEEADDSINLSDLTLDDFLAELIRYIQQNREALEFAPLGIHAVVSNAVSTASAAQPDIVRPGVIFCFKRNGAQTARTPNRLWPYFLGIM